MKFIKNFSYTLTSNLTALLSSALVILVLPKLIGVEEYGFWQLYLFYSFYVGFIHLGWNDGIYLRYGGREYKDLDKHLFFSQFYMLFISQAFVAVIIFISSLFLMDNANRLFIMQMVAIALVIVNTRFMLLFILQATNRIKEYAKITMLDRVLYIILIISFLLFGVRDYKLLIIADLISKFIALIYAMYYCKEIVFNKLSNFNFSFKETLENINIGMKLMFANLASMLIIGVVRFGIERSWSVATFGKVSLTLSISNLTMLFINAVGIIMFPILRRTDPKKLADIYVTMRDFLMVILLFALLLYYPLNVLISTWLPQYAESLMYMILVFPMFVYEGKMQLLINSYLKNMRKEKMMLNINLISLLLSLIITFITTQLLKSLDLAILSIVILLAFRSVLAEFLLSKILKISIHKDIFLELFVTLIFILSAWYIDSWYSIVVFGFVYCVYLIMKRNDIMRTIKKIRTLLMK